MLELKQKYGTVAIANLGGHSEEEYVEGAAMLSDSAVDIVEPVSYTHLLEAVKVYIIALLRLEEIDF